MITCLTPDELASALAVTDLTDPEHGPHALQRLLDDVVTALAATGPSSVQVVRDQPVVTTADNYDRLASTRAR